MIEYEEAGYLIREHANGTIERILICAAPPPGPITRAELLDRFTDDELGGIKRLAETNDTAAGWVEWLLAQPAIALNHARLTAGLARLVTAGKMTQDRVDQILAE